MDLPDPEPVAHTSAMTRRDARRGEVTWEPKVSLERTKSRPPASPGPDTAGADPNEDAIQRWVREATDGNENAFEKLVETFAHRLQVTVYRMVLNWDDARDVAQESFVQAYRSLGRYRPTAKFQSWLFTIASRKALDLLRRKSHRPVELPGGMQSKGGAAAEQGVEDRTVQRGELLRAIEAAVCELPPEQRTAFTLAEYEGWSQRQIADMLGISTKGVEMHLYRARATLRERLRGWFSG